MSKADVEWDLMYKEYIERVPRPVYREDPPVKTALEEQTKVEEKEIDEDQRLEEV